MNGSRRGFLQGACAGLGATLLDRTISPNDDLESTFKDIRQNLLEMINEERDVAKVQPVVFDELATEVATKHAVDLATKEFIGHWGSDRSLHQGAIIIELFDEPLRTTKFLRLPRH